MSPTTMNYIYYAAIALFGIIMIISPQSFLVGKSKFTEEGYKTQKLLKKIGIVIVIVQVVLIIYTLLK